MQRIVNPFQPVHVYRNLRSKVWSIRQGGLVMQHATSLTLCRLDYDQPVQFVVSEAGRARVLATGQRNVHATVRGILLATNHDPEPHDHAVKVSYSPFRGPTFTAGPARTPFLAAQVVHFTRDGDCWASHY